MAKFSTKLQVSTKHIQIDKANKTTIIAVSFAAAIVVFSVIATQALIKQISYQNKVISMRTKASDQIKKNLDARTTLVKSYEAFDSASESVIGTKDNNSKIILDSLPSKYDFPALATSLEGLVAVSGLSVGSITGVDNEAAALQESPDPSPVDMEFTVSGTGNIVGVQNMLTNIERSIRPIKVGSIELTANQGDSLTLLINGKTYYQPSRKLEIKQEIVTANNVKKQAAASPTSTVTPSPAGTTK